MSGSGGDMGDGLHKNGEGSARPGGSEAPAVGRGGRCPVLRPGGRFGRCCTNMSEAILQCSGYSRCFPAQANRSAVLPLSADKRPPVPGCPRLCPGKPSARPRPIGQKCCPYPRISGPLCRNRCANNPKGSARPGGSEAPAMGRGGRCPVLRPGGTGWPVTRQYVSSTALIRG